LLEKAPDAMTSSESMLCPQQLMRNQAKRDISFDDSLPYKSPFAFAFFFFAKIIFKPGRVAQAYNPSYEGGRHR
jgi:hypothetical protein